VLEYFNDSCEPCGNCDTCLEPVASFDGTLVAQKALSCVYRTGQIFGAGHVIDVLTGANGERVQKLGHDKLSTFGIGKDFTKEEWRSIFRQLVAAGLLKVDVEGHGSLGLTEACREVLRGEKKISLRRDPVQKKAAGNRAARERVPLTDPDDEELFQALRKLRLELARDQGVPPYVIFNDATLLEMARERPRSLHEMSRLTGVGKTKLETYGETFLEVVDGYGG